MEIKRDYLFLSIDKGTEYSDKENLISYLKDGWKILSCVTDEYGRVVYLIELNKIINQNNV